LMAVEEVTSVWWKVTFSPLYSSVTILSLLKRNIYRE
jgi:hypothetical protein